MNFVMKVVWEIEVGGFIVNDVLVYCVDYMLYGGVKKSGMGKEGFKYVIEEMIEEWIIVFNL